MTDRLKNIVIASIWTGVQAFLAFYTLGQHGSDQLETALTAGNSAAIGAVAFAYTAFKEFGRDTDLLGWLAGTGEKTVLHRVVATFLEAFLAGLTGTAVTTWGEVLAVAELAAGAGVAAVYVLVKDFAAEQADRVKLALAA
ncbi:MAG: hypothetical protein AAFZ07_16495 [Actinomycetota bacterium]